jgi:predicted Zn-dependent protease
VFHNIDEKGITLGKRKNNIIILDEQENWNLTSNNNEKNSYLLLNVLTHEIGHLLGFNHMNNDKMYNVPIL